LISVEIRRTLVLMTKRASGLLLLSVAALSLSASGCATARVNRFRGFAEAGAVYVKTTAVVLDEAEAAAIAADSMVLEKSRPGLTPEQRGKTILEHNELLRERLALLADLRRHGMLLRSYFEALAALAESDGPSGIGDAAEGLVTSLGQLHPRIENAKVGDLAVSGFVGKAANLVVARFRLSALERELELQKAALTVVTEQMETDLKATLLQRESNEVVLPYAGEDPLPKSWAEKRQEILLASVRVSSARAAADAAEKMKIAFVALVEGRFTQEDLSALISDVNEIISLIEDVQATPNEAPAA
jgi:hypothetical protein